MGDDPKPVEVLVAPHPTIVHRLTVGPRAFVVASGHRRWMLASSPGVTYGDPANSADGRWR